MTEEIRDNAIREADLIKAQAEVDSREGGCEMLEMNWRESLGDTISLKLRRRVCNPGIKTVVESHRRLLEAQEELDRQVTAQRKGQNRRTSTSGGR